MNPKKKSEYSIRRWRIKQKFVSVVQLSSKLIESFEELHCSDESNVLSMGYIEPGHGYKGKQRWLCSDEDLHDMYAIYSGKKEILMWCFVPGKQSKRPQPSDHSGGTSTKRLKIVDSNSKSVQEIVTKLQSKHGSMFTPEQYHAWGQLIQMGKQSSYDDPPPYTFFKVAPKKSSRTTSAMFESGPSAIHSPGKRVHLRTELFTQLDQCDELKRSIMGDINEKAVTETLFCINYRNNQS